MSEESVKQKLPPDDPPKPTMDDRPDPDAWMVTFSDLLILLMTFFVLIFASQDATKEKLFQAFGQSVGVFSMFRTSFYERISAVQRQDISQDRVEVFLDEIGALDIDVLQEERGLVISLPSRTLFAPGSAVLRAKAVARISKLAELLKYTRHSIRVEGHTDNREQLRGQVGSGWQLSAERAHVVLLRLERGQVPSRRLSLAGYGSVRPKFSNVSRRGRERNRRVEILILNRETGL